MGHKVHPHGFRLGVIKGWDSRWYAGRNYKDLLAEDRKLRAAIRKRLANAGVSRIEIERVAGTQIGVSIHTAKPGIVIGRSGESVERLRQELERLTKKKVRLNILKSQPDVDATWRLLHRRAAREACLVPPRDETGGAEGDACGREGIRVVAGGRPGGRPRAPRKRSRAACRCRHCAPTSTSAWWRRDLRRLRCQGLDLPWRGAPGEWRAEDLGGAGRRLAPAPGGGVIAATAEIATGAVAAASVEVTVAGAASVPVVRRVRVARHDPVGRGSVFRLWAATTGR
jgi:ribosomal protein S3